MAPRPERFGEFDRLFLELADTPEAERRRRLAELAARDATLAREVAGLLRADGQAAPLFDGELPWTVAVAAAAPVGPGERLGAYRILEEIGRGGMSVVYRAARDDRRFEQEVAIKVCRREPGLSSFADHLAAECRILARLEHPVIARLLDAGSTAGGLPYFVLELVHGERIDAFCAARGLDPFARLALFRRALDAVVFAHQRLIVHRDLKPSNILVTAEGAPKLLDFGIAKLLGGPEEGGEATVTGLHPLTPHYASPEQLRGEAVTTATDIYSLGVVLFKVLTGELPRGEEPRLGSAVPAPRTLLRDLDAILGKALRPEPEERYRSVAELADDLDRLRAGLPVEARAGSRSYRLAKLLRRHRVPVAAAASLLLVSGAFLASALWQAAEVRRERDQSQEVLRFFFGLFSEPGEGTGPQSVDELLARGALRLSASFEGSPRVKATLLDRLGALYADRGFYRDARPLLEGALSLRRVEHGEESAEVAETRLHLSTVERGEGRWREAEAALTEVLAALRRLLPAEDPGMVEALSALAAVRRDLGAFGGAEALAREALAAVAGQSARAGERAEVELLLGEILRRQGRWSEAMPLLNSAVTFERSRRDPAPLALAAGLNHLANLEFDLGRFGSAGELYREALALHSRRRPAAIEEVFVIRNNLGRALAARGEVDEALGLHRGNLQSLEASGQIHHPSYGAVLHNMADALAAAGKPADAEPLFRRALAVRLEALGPNHPQVAQTQDALAGLLARRGHGAEAEALYRQSIATFAAALPAGHPHGAWPRIGLAQLLAAQGKTEEAKTLLVEAIHLLAAAVPAEHSKLVEARRTLAALDSAGVSG